MTLVQEATTLTPEAFEARFSDLVELICDAAQAGVKPFMEAQYTVLRAWMSEHFPPVANVFSGPLQTEFESLFLPETLTEVLRRDEGALMMRLLDTQSAIATWKNAQISG
jgi:hypothetical protein